MYIPTTPEVLGTPAKLPTGQSIIIQQTINRYEIESFSFDRDPNDQAMAQLKVIVLRGYDDGSGALVAVDRSEYRFGGANTTEGTGSITALMLVLGGTVPTGASYYDAVRNALWTLLEQSGAIPPGTMV
jgi:hypothetical protein